MLCVPLKSYNRPCGGVTGGVSAIWVFDPADFVFTLDPATGRYMAVARREGATAEGGALMFPIKFQAKEAELKFKHSVTGCSVKYEHELTAQLPDLGSELTEFLMSMDAAGCCCGLGLVVELNTGKIFILGERYVNGSRIPYFEVKMDGTEGGSGKKFEDFNGANVIFKGEYSRNLRQFGGGIQIIEGYEVAPVTPEE